MRKIAIIFMVLFSPAIYAQGNGGVEFGWYGLIPALFAIVLAVISKQVILSLLIGVVTGAFIFSFSDQSNSFAFGLDHVFDHYLLQALANKDHASILLFSLLISAGIHVMTKMGAFNGLVLWLSRYAKSKKSALLITYFLGFVVFFDDYANTLVVGNTMRKITDRFKISREKLAFIVDATAAPIASVAIVSTWIGYEIQLIGDAISDAPYPGMENGFSVFIHSVGYSFYPLVILGFILVLILSQKDFGPMLQFEKDVQLIDQKIEDEEAKSIKAIWAVIPIVILLFVTMLGIYSTGKREGGLIAAIQTGDCYKGLIWGSGAFLAVVTIISLFNRNRLEKNIVWIMDGMKSLFSAMAILVLAWTLTAVLTDLQLGAYLGHLIQNNELSFHFIPAITFVLAAIIAFSTGSSFSTMGILIPIIVAVCLSFYSTTTFDLEIFYAAVASVLSGAVLGDHCSPISDTTILSSLATGCNHINHVNSQLIYCLICGGIALFLIILNSLIGLNLATTYLFGVASICLIIKLLGRRSYFVLES